MRLVIPFVLFVGLLLAASFAAVGQTPDEELQGQLDKTLEDLTGDVEDTTQLEAQEEEEAPLTTLLSGVGGIFEALGAAVSTGLGHVAGAATSMATATTTAMAAAVLATRQALVWSVTGVFGMMTGTVGSLVTGIGAVLSGAWALLASLSSAAAYGRPSGVSQAAWAGGVAVGVTAASAAGNLGIWNLLRRFGWVTAALPLFSRIEKDDLLDHPLRSEIYEAIKATPGIHISELARTVDAGWGTTIHHLRKLKDEDMVAVRVVNNQKCYFINGGTTGRDAWGAISHLKNATARKIAQFVHSNPLIAVTELSARLGISASLVSHHVAKLTRAGVLEKVRDGRFIRLAVTDKAAATMFPQHTVTPTAHAPVAA